MISEDNERHLPPWSG